MIPPRTKEPARTADGHPACEFCHREMTQTHGAAELVSGWVPNRAQGGANAVSVVAKHNRWACHLCWPLIRRGIQPNPADRPHDQTEMFPT